jgi:PAS domain S-box-containing protein
LHLRAPAIRLTLLALVTIVPALTFIAYDQAIERERARAQAVDDTVGLARLAASGQASVVYGVERLLFTLSHVAALRAPDACTTLLTSVLRDHPGYTNIRVVSPDGSPYCQGAPVPAGTSAVGRAWFDRVIATRAAAMSDYQVGPTGTPDVVIAEPLFGADGRVERVLAAGLAVTQFSAAAESTGVPAGASFTIADRHGTILARSPRDPRVVGQTLPAALSLDRAQRTGRHELIAAPGTSGADRLYALVPVRATIDSGLYVAMDISPDAVFAAPNDLLRTNLWLLGLVALLTIAGGLVAGRLFVLRPMKALTDATARIAAGDFRGRTQLPRAAPGLRDLAESIDRMAAALETRERTRAEVDEQLHASERRYRLLFEANPHPMWVYDMETLRFLEVNEAAVRLYGYTRDEFLAMSVTAMVGPEDVARARATLAAMKTAPRYAGQWRHHLKHGGTIDVEIASHEILFNGRPARLGTGHDITRRVQAESAVRDAEARMRFALDAARVGTWEAQIADGATYWSETTEIMHGLTPGTFGGTMADVLTCIHPDDRDRVQAAFDRAMHEHGTLSIDYRTLAPDGTQRWVSAKGQFYYDPHGRAVRAGGVTIDVTEQRRLEEQLRQSQKMEAIGQLAGGIAHDFNNVLTAILGNAEIYLDDAPADDPNRQTIEEIQVAGRAAVNLVRQLLAFSRRQTLAPKVLRLGDSIREVTPILQRLLGPAITLRTELTDTRMVEADPGQIQQVLINLTVNARDAMPQGGVLRIETADATLDDQQARRDPSLPRGRYVSIRVTDNGHGMDAETQQRLFEPFFTTKAPGQGTGLGLATVHGIVQQSEGHITVETAPGRGTSFTVYLPQTDATAPSPPEPISPAPFVKAVGSETVLLVEDEGPVRDFIHRALTMFGYRVHALPDAVRAIEFARDFQDRIHMIVADVVLPEINGQIMAARVRALHPEARVLYISGFADIALVTGAAQEPGTWFLRKPFTAEGLGQHVRAVLDA